MLGQMRAVWCESACIRVCGCGKTLRGVKLEEKPQGSLKEGTNRGLERERGSWCWGEEKPPVRAPKQSQRGAFLGCSFAPPESPTQCLPLPFLIPAANLAPGACCCDRSRAAAPAVPCLKHQP